MKIQTLPIMASVGHISVHAVKAESIRLPKGALITAEQASLLQACEVTEIVCAIADVDDINEDEAAHAVASVLHSQNIVTSTAATGRVNFTCASLGIIRYDRERLKRINLVDEGITLALVQHNQLLAAGNMLATLKIIPFFVSRESVDKVISLLQEKPLFHFYPLMPKKACLIQTRFSHQSPALFKTTAAITQARLHHLGCQLSQQKVIPHTADALRSALLDAASDDCELLLISGASAIAHRDDLIPSVIGSVGGNIDHFGLAVDPGNLLMLGHLGNKMIIGMPGCARSPKLNGFDWVLHLYLAGISIDEEELAEMASGGLLMEIASRPLPRALHHSKSAQPHIEGVLLAAGTSSRMAEGNKLLMDLDGMPLIRRVADNILSSTIDGLTIILGHDAEAVGQALEGINARFIFNPEFSAGQASSVCCGLNHLPKHTTDMMVFLADMPLLTSETIDLLLLSHISLENRWSRMTAPIIHNQRRNPVIWGKSFFQEISEIEGDVGAKNLFDLYPEALNSVPFTDERLFLDADTAQDFERIEQHYNTHSSISINRRNGFD